MYDYEALLWAAVALPIVGSIAIGGIVMVACIMAAPSENSNEFTDPHRDP
jgi:ABC-type Mn2+/Zn2+ transport system permease subunit